MSSSEGYEVRFLDHQGNPIEDVTLQAWCLALAVACPDILSPEVGADVYYVMANGMKVRAEWCRSKLDGDFAHVMPSP